MSVPPPTDSPPHAGDELEPEPAGGLCPRCGAAYEHGQEYCLECGLRLPPAVLAERGAAAAADAVEPPFPPGWLWVVLIFLVIAALGAAAAIAFSREDDANGSTFAATELPPAATTTQPARTTPPQTTAPAQTRPGTRTGTRTNRPPERQPGALTTWPRGRDGYTVILASLPATAGLSPARARAREAASAGLPQVGVLESSRYASLHAGYYVVFSGIYDTLADAQAAVANASSSGYRDAYASEVAS